MQERLSVPDPRGPVRQRVFSVQGDADDVSAVIDELMAEGWIAIRVDRDPPGWRVRAAKRRQST